MTVKRDPRFPHACPGEGCAICQRLREEQARSVYYSLERANTKPTRTDGD